MWITPSPDGIGILDSDQWQQTVDISLESGIITDAPSDDAFRTNLAQAALDIIDEDATGDGFTKGSVEATSRRAPDVMPTLVAVSAAARNTATDSGDPRTPASANPPANGSTTPSAPTARAVGPTRSRSWSRVSTPTWKRSS
ncbi:MAG: hypothetical protein ABIO99_04105, partial [Candidatus Limnocylindria bacterium]